MRKISVHYFEWCVLFSSVPASHFLIIPSSFYFDANKILSHLINPLHSITFEQPGLGYSLFIQFQLGCSSLLVTEPEKRWATCIWKLKMTRFREKDQTRDTGMLEIAINYTKKKLKTMHFIYLMCGNLSCWQNGKDAEKLVLLLSCSSRSQRLALFHQNYGNLFLFGTIFVITMLIWQRLFERCHCECYFEQCRWTNGNKICFNLSAHWKELRCDKKQLDTSMLAMIRKWALLANYSLNYGCFSKNLFDKRQNLIFFFFGLNSSFKFLSCQAPVSCVTFWKSATEYVQIIIIIMEMCSRRNILIRNVFQKWHEISSWQTFTFTIKSRD